MNGCHCVKEKETAQCPTLVEVAVGLPVAGTYTYQVSSALSPFVSSGKRVLVPFGQRKVTGYVLGIGTDVSEQKEIKAIIDVLDEQPLFPAEMIPFFQWIASYYMHPIGEVIRNALPSGLNPYDYVVVQLTENGRNHLAACRQEATERAVLEHLGKGPCRLKELYKAMEPPLSASSIQAMESCGWIRKERILKKEEVKPLTEAYAILEAGCGSDGKLSLQRKKIVDLLSEEKSIPVKSLIERLPTTAALVRSMEKERQIRICHRRIYRDPFGEEIPADSPPALTGEQHRAVEAVLNALGKGFSTFLLAGVTGSGKTEVYLQLAAAALKRGVSALVLVPEIALISQTERRFRARFGECVAVLHSRLSPGERYDQWIRILRKEVSIVIGARSAIFAPFSDLGLIIVDEEHDSSYKQEHKLRYNARDLAIVRAKHHRAVALLGSATPSVQSYYNVKKKNFIELSLENRVESRSLPEITVVDLSLHRHRRGIGRFITPELKSAIKEALDRREQVMIFLNRRGFAGFAVCSACGEPIRCKKCDISLTLHKEDHAYRCHYCGYSQTAACNCTCCGSSKIYPLGLGTEKIEEAMKSLFPGAVVARMDRDATLKKGTLLKILKDLRNRTIDILVGTQMIAKGHDFPHITLVGVVCADLSLNFPDFRSGERTFQLLAQVAGRAGRGDMPGRVILQTYNPTHFSIEAAKEQDFRAFYHTEIEFRKTLDYPPFSRMILVKISGKDRQRTEQSARELGEACHLLKSRRFGSIEVLGPVPAPVSKIADRFRWQILMKDASVKRLHRFVYDIVKESGPIARARNIRIAVDVDPVSMM